VTDDDFLPSIGSQTNKKKKTLSKTPMELRLFNGCKGGKLHEVKNILKNHPGLNINWANRMSCHRTALHSACSWSHHDIVALLLAHPDINVNQQDEEGESPFYRSCFNVNLRVLKLLMKDPRVDINLSNHDGCTPLWWACYCQQDEVVKWMIVLRGDDLNLAKKGREPYEGIDCKPVEIAEKYGSHKMVSMLKGFEVNPRQIKHDIQVELGFCDALAAELFAMTVFLCDGLLKLTIRRAHHSGPLLPQTNATRFFVIAQRLPMELQMILCHVVYNSSKENILSKDSELAFKSLTKNFTS
jgi:hypothetical protein